MDNTHRRTENVMTQQNPSPVGVINLECLMNRANILFTGGYRFRGELDVEKLRDSFLAIVNNIEKFRYQLQFKAQNDFSWQPLEQYEKRFLVIDAADIDREFQQLCRNSLSLVEDDKRSPMVLTVIRDCGGSQEFILAQTSEHTYVDDRGAATILSLIIDHYNALCQGEAVLVEEIIAMARQIKTISSSEMMDIRSAGGLDRDANIKNLTDYPVADAGGYVIPLEQVPACLEEYQQQRHAPIIRFFNIQELLYRCRAKYPEVTQNSVVCAALAKGFYNMNVSQRNAPDKHLISCKMLSDLLSPELRRKYLGNYIAFVPVSVEGDLPIEEMAKCIHDRIRHFKDSKLDATIFKLVEEAVDAAQVGTSDDALSFVVTNWTNHRFLGTPHFLHGCQSLRHQSGVNIEPKDTLGAILVNRPILVINMSFDYELCLSFFPSLRSEAENRAVAAHIEQVFDQFGTAH